MNELETSPRDGKPFIGFDHLGIPTICHWISERNRYEVFWNGDEIVTLVGWLPVPTHG